jgi:hypothetical protein
MTHVLRRIAQCRRRWVPRAAAMAIALLAWPIPRAGAGAVHVYDHVVVVMEENESVGQIIGNPALPYINSLANNGANFTNSFAIEHPSEPNYLDIFSGSNQGVTDDGTHTPPAFTTPNLGASLIAAGKTFGGYSESLPYAGFTGSSSTTDPSLNQYVLKHNPWVNWQGTGPNGIPAADNMPFSSFPDSSNYASLPTISFVVPNEQDDMHDGTPPEGDAWLKSNLGAYATWALTHNSLLIVTWDEGTGNGGTGNNIPTIFYGADINPMQYSETINDFSVLRTLEDMYGLPYAGASAEATPITYIFAVPEPSSLALSCLSLIGLFTIAAKRKSTLA